MTKDERWEAIHRGRQEHLTLREIAAAVDMSEGGVQYAMSRMGICHQGRAARPTQYPERRLQKKHGRVVEGAVAEYGVVTLEAGCNGGIVAHLGSDSRTRTGTEERTAVQAILSALTGF